MSPAADLNTSSAAAAQMAFQAALSTETTAPRPARPSRGLHPRKDILCAGLPVASFKVSGPHFSLHFARPHTHKLIRSWPEAGHWPEASSAAAAPSSASLFPSRSLVPNDVTRGCTGCLVPPIQLHPAAGPRPRPQQQFGLSSPPAASSTTTSPATDHPCSLIHVGDDPVRPSRDLVRGTPPASPNDNRPGPRPQRQRQPRGITEGMPRSLASARRETFPRPSRVLRPADATSPPPRDPARA